MLRRRSDDRTSASWRRFGGLVGHSFPLAVCCWVMTPLEEYCHGGTKHPARASYPVEEGSMTARDVNLAKFEYSSIGAKGRCYRPNRFSWIGNDRGNPGDQISHRMFKPGVEAGSDHFLSGRPRGDRKPDDTYPSYHFQHSSGPLLARPKATIAEESPAISDGAK